MFKDLNVFNAEAGWIVGTHCDPERDVQFTCGPVDDLEDASVWETISRGWKP